MVFKSGKRQKVVGGTCDEISEPNKMARHGGKDAQEGFWEKKQREEKNQYEKIEIQRLEKIETDRSISVDLYVHIDKIVSKRIIFMSRQT